MLALAANDNHVPVIVCSHLYNRPILEHGGLIPIEERSAREVLDIQVGGHAVTPSGASARNPGIRCHPKPAAHRNCYRKGVVYSALYGEYLEVCLPKAPLINPIAMEV